MTWKDFFRPKASKLPVFVALALLFSIIPSAFTLMYLFSTDFALADYHGFPLPYLPQYSPCPAAPCPQLPFLWTNFILNLAVWYLLASVIACFLKQD